jgi:hypothetical protein
MIYIVSGHLTVLSEKSGHAISRVNETELDNAIVDVTKQDGV